MYAVDPKEIAERIVSRTRNLYPHLRYALDHKTRATYTEVAEIVAMGNDRYADKALADAAIAIQAGRMGDARVCLDFARYYATTPALSF